MRHTLSGQMPNWQSRNLFPRIRSQPFSTKHSSQSPHWKRVGNHIGPKLMQIIVTNVVLVIFSSPLKVFQTDDGRVQLYALRRGSIAHQKAKRNDPTPGVTDSEARSLKTPKVPPKIKMIPRSGSSRTSLLGTGGTSYTIGSRPV
jgi:hypothetical protein